MLPVIHGLAYIWISTLLCKIISIFIGHHHCAGPYFICEKKKLWGSHSWRFPCNHSNGPLHSNLLFSVFIPKFVTYQWIATISEITVRCHQGLVARLGLRLLRTQEVKPQHNAYLRFHWYYSVKHTKGGRHVMISVQHAFKSNFSYGELDSIVSSIFLYDGYFEIQPVNITEIASTIFIFRCCKQNHSGTLPPHLTCLLRFTMH